VIEFGKLVNVIPNFWYYTYSQGRTRGNNFRVIFILSEKFNVDEFEEIYLKFLKLFSKFKPDQSTKDASRFFFGGTPGAFITNELVDITPLESIKVKVSRKKINSETASNPPSATLVPADWYEKISQNECDLLWKWRNKMYLNRTQRFLLFSNVKFLKLAEGDIIQEFLNLSDADVYKDSSGYGYSELERWYNDSRVVPAKIVTKFGIPTKQVTLGEMLSKYNRKEVE